MPVGSPKKGNGSPESKVIGYYESLNMGAGNKLQFSERGSTCS